MLRPFLLTVSCLLLGCGADAQDAPRADLYQCEGCEAVHEFQPETWRHVATMAGPDEAGERLTLTGTAYQTDGTTPADGIIIYAYQTNADGLYANGSPETQWSRRHGNLRGWVKTNADGRYRFETIKPAPYPDQPYPAHIHLTILEPGYPPYYIDDVVFDGEFGVTDSYRARMDNRGDDGISQLVDDGDGTLSVTRDIVLEMHPDNGG